MSVTTVDFRPEEPPPSPIAAAPFHEWVFPDGTLWTSFYRTKEGYLLRFASLADFALDERGFSIRAWAAPGVHAETMQILYLNQVLPLAWSKQGKIVLHSSAVEVEGHAIGFVGRSGFGKSTLAASFATDGYPFLTDDGLVLEPVDDGYAAQPSHPSIRLRADSQEALIAANAANAAFATSIQYTSKVRVLAGAAFAFCAQPRPIQRLYFLGEDALEPKFSQMKPSEALVELVKNSFLLDTTEQAALSAHFDGLSRLAALPICFRLNYPRSYRDLPMVRESILHHSFAACEAV